MKCPKCGSEDVVRPDDPKAGGAGCESCGHRGRLKDFRQAGAKPLDAPLTPEETESMEKFLGKFKVGDNGRR